jgi:hypothetical protein
MTPLERKQPEPCFEMEETEPEIFEPEEELARKMVIAAMLEEVINEIKEKQMEGVQLENEEFLVRQRLLFLPDMEDRIIVEQIRDLQLALFSRELLSSLESIVDEEDDIQARDLLSTNLLLAWVDAQNALTRIYFYRWVSYFGEPSLKRKPEFTAFSTASLFRHFVRHFVCTLSAMADEKKDPSLTRILISLQQYNHLKSIEEKYLKSQERIKANFEKDIQKGNRIIFM